MAWEHLSITKPHLVYIILGGFTSLFMLCSSVIKERLYIGEATVATICGIIFGPHAANLIDPNTWGNTDLITNEFSRLVLVVQCFAVGVELPKAYMERHWKSVTFLLVPVMTFGWLITSLFIWWLFRSHLNWLDSLCIAACVTATDPVLASSVVGKGKFAKRVPKHLRDLLSAESGCNDGMAFPFIYLAIYLIRYRPDANEVAFHWFCYSILYECIFGAVYGVLVGYIARRAIRYAHEHDLIDRESFLVFYFVLALFCAGSGSLLGMDDLLIGFACGVGFSNDGWFLAETEESHVSNVIDLLINLAFFVYFGTIIPWEQYNAPALLGITPWRLVVLGIFVLLFRRIPVMMALKPLIPDIKTWREALFAGHFGPIGVGGLFVAILARAELETESTTPLAELPEPGFEHLNIIEMIWPITTFLVICSIVVHGSSIAVFTLGKHINTLQLTFSYTQANEEGPSWMDRLPRIQSRSKSQASSRRPYDTDESMDEKMPYPTGALLSGGLKGQFLRRQKEEDTPSRASSLRPSARRKKWDSGRGPGGPVSQSAIIPQRIHREQSDQQPSQQREDSDTIAASEATPASSLEKEKSSGEPEEEIYEEGDKTVIEDEEGNVLGVRSSHGESQADREKAEEKEARQLARQKHVRHGVAQDEHGHVLGDDKDIPPFQRAYDDPQDEEVGQGAKSGGAAGGGAGRPVRPSIAPNKGWDRVRRRMSTFGPFGLAEKAADEENTGAPLAPTASAKTEAARPKRGAARAYQFGNTIIVEDEDGEVIKKYDIPSNKRPGPGDRQASFLDTAKTKQRLQRMGDMLGMGAITHREDGSAGAAAPDKGSAVATGTGADSTKKAAGDDDDKIRFTFHAGGRRMSAMDFIKQMQTLDPKARAELVENSDVPDAVKREARRGAEEAKVVTRTRSGTQTGPSKDTGRLTAQISPSAAGEGPSMTSSSASPSPSRPPRSGDKPEKRPKVSRVATHEDRPTGPEGLALVDSEDVDIPFHAVGADLARYQLGNRGINTAPRETAAMRRRRQAAGGRTGTDADDDVSPGPDTSRGRTAAASASSSKPTSSGKRPETGAFTDEQFEFEGETAAERRRRLGALGVHGEQESESSDESEDETGKGIRQLPPEKPKQMGIRFAPDPRGRGR
jgi:sodium/hydrogen antiporter